MEQGTVNIEEIDLDLAKRKWLNRPASLMHLSFAEYCGEKVGTLAVPADQGILNASLDLLAAPLEPPSLGHRPRHEAGKMNRLETKYAAHLDTLVAVHEVRQYRFEPMKLRLAPSTYLDVDFLVWMDNNTVELHEVKGHWEDDARVKIKVAATMFPWWRFVGVQWDKQAKDWKYERFKNG